MLRGKGPVEFKLYCVRNERKTDDVIPSGAVTDEELAAWTSLLATYVACRFIDTLGAYYTTRQLNKISIVSRKTIYY